MLYGDSPVKLNEHEDALGLNRYTLLPDILAVRQSSNLYTYCVANPIGFVDQSGDSIILACILIGAAVGAVAGGIYGAHRAKTAGYSIDDGWKYLRYVLGYGIGGAAGGALIGWGVGAAAAAIGATATAGSSGTLGIAVYETWQQAEQAVRDMINSVSTYAERVFSTPFGKRIVDAYNPLNEVIAEAKYGYVSLTQFIEQQISKDAFLLQNNVVSSVEWHFFKSQVTGLGGPSDPLLKRLLEEGFKVIFH